MPFLTSFKFKFCFSLSLGMYFVGFMMVSGQAFAAADSGVTDLNVNSVASASKMKLGNTMNFGDCMEFSIKPCVQICPGGFLTPPYPTVGIEPKYTEPTAVIETSCLRGSSDLGNAGSNFMTKLLAGSALKKPDEQKCSDGFKTGKGVSSIKYNEARVFGVAPATRYLSSGSAGDVTKSLTCGIFGAAGMFMNLSNVLGGFSNFSLANIGKQISSIPKNIMANVQNSLNNFTTQLSNLPQTITSTIQNIPADINNAISGIQSSITNSVQGFQSALNSFGDIGNQLAGFQQDLINGNLGAKLTGELNGFIQPYRSAFESLGNMDLANLNLNDLTELQNLNFGEFTSSLGEFGSALSGIPGMPSSIVSMGESFQGLQAITDSDWKNSIEQLKAVKTVGGQTALNKLIQEAGTEDIATLMALHMAKEVEKEAPVHDRRYAQTGNGADYGEGVDDVYVMSSFAGIGELPIVTSVNGEMHPTGRFLSSGSSQLAAETARREYDAEKNQLEYLGKEGLSLAKQARNASVAESQSMCQLQSELRKIKKEVNRDIKSIQQKGLTLFPKGTYLPLGFRQKIDDINKKTYCESYWSSISGYYGRDRDLAPTSPFADSICGYAGTVIDDTETITLTESCLKTHAGYQLQAVLDTGMGSKRVYPNCSWVCEGERGDRECKWKKNDPNLKGSCEGNRLSQYTVDGKYPACLDDRQALNTSARNAMMSRLTTTKNQIQQSLDIVNQRINRLNVSCQVTGAVDQEEDAVIITTSQSPEKPSSSVADIDQFSLSAADSKLTLGVQTAALPSGIGDTPGNGAISAPSDSFGLGVAEFGGSIEAKLGRVTSIMREGGVQQTVNGWIGKKMPFGLYPAFISEMTNWAQPPKFDIIGQMKMQIGSVVQATAAPFLCTAPAIAADYGVVSPKAMATMNKIANCIGQWGPMHPLTGFAHHKNPSKAAALSGYRGYMEAVRLGAIQPNTKGATKIDMSRAAFTDGGKFKGKGCYNVGTSKRLDGGVMAMGEGAFNFTLPKKASLNKDEMVDVGNEQHTFSVWKNTACCIYFCGTLFGGAGPKVKRKY